MISIAHRHINRTELSITVLFLMILLAWFLESNITDNPTAKAETTALADLPLVARLLYVGSSRSVSPAENKANPANITIGIYLFTTTDMF
jgi:hypothetical protein